MIINMPYWTSVLKRVFSVLIIITLLYLAIKLSIFYMPFLVAFIISLIMEPAIKFVMKKLKLTRKASSIIVFLAVITLLSGTIVWGISTLFSEASNLLQGLNDYIEKAYNLFNLITKKMDFKKFHLPIEVTDVLQNSTEGVLNNFSAWLKSLLNRLIKFITSVPIIAIYSFITIMALYLICVDKIYILDQFEHHLPRKWVMKIGVHVRELIKTLSGYLKAESILILISFIICLIGLYILKIAKFKIEFPLLMALFIGFVDALPILGSGTVMIPWAILSGVNGDIKLGIAIIILFAIITTIRQFLEPRLVSKHIGTHPIFTLIAMYTGFRFAGVAGLLIGPIVLIIIKNVFATLIDDGIVKSILDKK